MITQQSLDLAHTIHASRLQEAENYRLLRQHEASQPQPPSVILRYVRHLLIWVSPIWPIAYQIN